jgi:hypothetical protein
LEHELSQVKIAHDMEKQVWEEKTQAMEISHQTLEQASSDA